MKTLTGFEQERALPGILGRANTIWENKVPLYRKLRNVYKQMVKDKKHPDDIQTTKRILTQMEQGNIFIAYDNLMRIFQDKPIYLSINPLDKLLSSGGEDSNSLTKFSV